MKNECSNISAQFTLSQKYKCRKKTDHKIGLKMNSNKNLILPDFQCFQEDRLSEKTDE